MPYIKALFHLVWSTKNRYPFLTKEIRKQVFEHIMQNAKTKRVYLYCVNDIPTMFIAFCHYHLTKQ